jgi:hypothetical protein
VDRLRGARMGNEFFGQQLVGFYVFLMVVLQQIRCMDVICWFPSVIALRVSSPFHQVLQGMTAPEASVIAYCFDFIFFFSFYYIQR